MPSLITSSSLKVAADTSSLAIAISHTLVAGQPSETAFKIRGAWPSTVDVYPAPQIALALSGACQCTVLGTHVVLHSAVASHLVSYLRTNAFSLGLNTITGPYIDADDDSVKVSLIPTHTTIHDLPHASCRLVSLNIHYVWKSPDGEQGIDATPFAETLLLPIKSVLDEAVEKLATHHLVKRYPLIFGPWRKRFDDEAALFPSLCRSISSIVQRSPNADFRDQVQRYIRLLNKRASKSRAASSAALRRLNPVLDLNTIDADDLNAKPLVDSGMDACISRSLGWLYQLGLRPSRFKGSLSGLGTKQSQDDQDFDLCPDDNDDMAVDPPSITPPNTMSCIWSEQCYPRDFPLEDGLDQDILDDFLLSDGIIASDGEDQAFWSDMASADEDFPTPAQSWPNPSCNPGSPQMFYSSDDADDSSVHTSGARSMGHLMEMEEEADKGYSAAAAGMYQSWAPRQTVKCTLNNMTTPDTTTNHSLPDSDFDAVLSDGSGGGLFPRDEFPVDLDLDFDAFDDFHCPSRHDTVLSEEPGCDTVVELQLEDDEVLDFGDT